MSKLAAHLLGRKAEKRAVHYLKEQGYAIRVCNYRFQRGEVDIIAEQSAVLVFVEVKVRTHLRFGFPEEFMTSKQKEWYHEVATHYVEESGWEGPIRFDIIAMVPNQPNWDLTHLQDAFY